MDAGDLAGVAVFKAALLKRPYRRTYWQLSAAIADIFFHIWQVNSAIYRCCGLFLEPLLRAFTSPSETQLLCCRARRPRPQRFDDTAAEDMIDAVLVPPLHACMHKAAPANLAAVMDEQNFQAGGPLAE